jgi:hypothetical protein
MHLMGIMPVLHQKHLSNLGSASVCYGDTEIVNSDQGFQFTCKAWIEAYAQHPQMSISLNGRGRAKDDIGLKDFVKRQNASIFTSS